MVGCCDLDERESGKAELPASAAYEWCRSILSARAFPNADIADLGVSST